MEKSSIKLTNSTSNSLVLFIEPWAEEILIDANQTISILQHYTEDARLEFEYIKEGMIFYGNISSKVIIYSNEKVIWESYS